MTKQEFLILARALKTVYQRDRFLSEKEELEIWHDHLKDLPYEVASVAINRYISTNVFPPTIAEIRSSSAKVMNPDIPDSGEAWERAMDAVHRYGSYDQIGLLNSLDPLTREAAKRFGTNDLCGIMEENKSTARAQFMRIYDQIAKRHQEDAAMSPDTRIAIQMLREKTLAQMDERLLDERKDMTYGIPEYEGSDDLEG